ncbi:hypothetical protein [Thalassobium sp. R2A62]|nr:hypothetical protein [Thalassobium sp. R2A62]EET49026.1 hypothetical protein TR2A62_2778 [Thalassobium sp. R2A62]MDG2453517.1 hypothetical protein [Paracoccaceae bacterium]
MGDDIMQPLLETLRFIRVTAILAAAAKILPGCEVMLVHALA